MTRFPDEIDTDADIPSVVDGVSEVSGETINALRDAVLAIQAALGTNPQGSAASLKVRLDQFFNEDGTAKSSALIAAGLISLPISNSQIASNAAIEEVKLDLDYSTSGLKDDINSNDLDILETQNLLNQLMADVSLHFAGVSNKHDGYAVTFDGLVGTSGNDSVSKAIHYIWQVFLHHRQTSVVGEHLASAISFSPPSDGPITAGNVQDAITQIDTAFLLDRRVHNLGAHSNGISSDGYTLLDGVLSNGAVLGCSILPVTPNSVKVGLVNSATVTGVNYDMSGISATSGTLKITATTGTNSRTITISNIESAEYPTGFQHLGIDAVVNYLNSQFISAVNHFPVTAFVSQNGTLSLQHNVNDSSCKIRVDSVANSAASPLGLSPVVGTYVSPSIEGYIVIDGYKSDELLGLYREDLALLSSSSTIDLGEVAGSAGLDLLPGSLVHIINHSTSSADGTYVVFGTSGTSAVLSTNVLAGSFTAIIYQDTAKLQFVGNQKCIDIAIDKNLDVYQVPRVETTVIQITGVKIVGASTGLDLLSGSWTLNKSGSTYTTYITLGGIAGVSATFEEGYIGNLQVYAPDGVSQFTLFVHDASPTIGTDQISVYKSQANKDVMVIASTHTDASSELQNALSLRDFGLTGLKDFSNSFNEGVLGAISKDFHKSGVIRGLSVAQIESGGQVITVNGGKAVVDGKLIFLDRSPISIPAADGTFSVVVNSSGKFEVFPDTGLIGYSSTDLRFSDKYCLICTFLVSSSVITSFDDCRFFIPKSESVCDLRVDVGSQQSHFKSLSAAINYAASTLNSGLRKTPVIRALSDVNISNLTIPAGMTLVCHEDLTVSQSLTVEALGSIQVEGLLTVSDTFTVNGGEAKVNDADLNIVVLSQGMLEVGGSVDVADAITIYGNTVLTGSSNGLGVITFSDLVNVGSLAFAATTVENVRISNLEFVMTYSTSTLGLVPASAVVTDCVIDNCVFRQSSSFTYPAPTTSRQGLLISGAVDRLSVINSTFSDLSHGIEVNSSSVVDDLRVIGNRFTSVTNGVVVDCLTIGTSERIVIEDNVYSDIFARAINITGSTASQIQFVSVEGNVFGNSGSSYGTNNFVRCIDAADVICIKNNKVFEVSTAYSAGASEPILCSAINSDIDGNIISDCIGAISITGGIAKISNNSIINCSNTALHCSSGTVLFSGNVVSTTSTGALLALTSGVEFICDANKFEDGGTSASTFTLVNGAIFTNNSVETGRFLMSGTASPPGRRSVVSGNRIVCNGLSSGNSMVLLPGTSGTDIAIVSDNLIECSGTASASAVQIVASGSGRMVFSGNSIKTTTGTGVISVSGVVSAITLDSNYFLYSGTAASAINISAGNVSVTNNVSAGVFTTAEIILSSSGSFVTGNRLGGTGTGGKVISYSNASISPGNFVKNNKGATETLVFSTANAAFPDSADWAISATVNSAYTITSVGTSSLAVVPLVGLPVGAQILTIGLLCTTPGAGSTLKIRGCGRSKASHALTTFGAEAVNAPSILQTITFTANSQIYVQDGQEYFLYISSSAANNILGQVIVTLRI